MAQDLKYSSSGRMKISAGYKPGNMAAFMYGSTKRKRKKQVARIGNSVVPIMAQKLVEANCPYLKVGERTPNLRIDDSGEQLKFA